MAQEVKLDELYQEVILDHNRHPHNWGRLEKPNAYSHAHNALCGDDYHLDLFVAKGGVIEKVKVEGAGCAISKASASMMTDAVIGKSINDVEQIKQNFIHLLTDNTVSSEVREGAGKLKFFEGVKNFPVRVKCATLAWHALEDALKDIK